MYIITRNRDKVIMHITETVEYAQNGNIILDDGTSIACIKEVTVNEVLEVPESIRTEKYCYTEEKGFYENENYVEPVDEKTEIEKLKEELSITQDAVASLTEMLLNKEA